MVCPTNITWYDTFISTSNILFARDTGDYCLKLAYCNDYCVELPRVGIEDIARLHVHVQSDCLLSFAAYRKKT